jgi:hypothetical protein
VAPLSANGPVSYVNPSLSSERSFPRPKSVRHSKQAPGSTTTHNDLFDEHGALIVDPGKDSDRLKIGQLAEGDTFWMVGRTRIGSVSEFVSQILAETAGQNVDEYSVRVVYNFSRVDFDGARTAYLKFTKDDLKLLQIMLDQLTPELP